MATLDSDISAATATAPQQPELHALLVDAKQKWLKHEMSFADSRDYFDQVATRCQNAGLPKLEELARHLGAELPDATHDDFNRNRDELTYKTRLHDNVYGRAYDTAFAAALVAKPPQRMLGSMTSLGRAIADQCLWKGADAATRQQKDQLINQHVDAVHDAMRHEPRGWEGASPLLQAFLNAPDTASRRAALDAFLCAPKTNGVDCLAIPYVAVKLVLYNPDVPPAWRQKADFNYGTVIGQQVNRQDKQGDFLGAFGAQQWRDKTTAGALLMPAIEPFLQIPGQDAVAAHAQWSNGQTDPRGEEHNLRGYVGWQLATLQRSLATDMQAPLEALLSTQLDAGGRPLLQAELDRRFKGQAPGQAQTKDEIKTQYVAQMAARLASETLQQLSHQVPAHLALSAQQLIFNASPDPTAPQIPPDLATHVRQYCMGMMEISANHQLDFQDAQASAKSTVEKSQRVGTMMRHQKSAVTANHLQPAVPPGLRNRPNFDHLAPRNYQYGNPPPTPAPDNRPSRAVQQALSHGLPWVGGVSGTTNLMLHYSKDLVDNPPVPGQPPNVNQNDVLLATMMFVNYDGGHSLHSSMWVGNQLDPAPLPALPPPAPPMQGPGLGLNLNLNPPAAQALATAIRAAPSRDHALALAADSAQEFVSDYLRLMDNQEDTAVADAAEQAFTQTMQHFRENSRYSDARLQALPLEEPAIVAAAAKLAPGAAQAAVDAAAAALAAANTAPATGSTTII
ncbi:hypothetical protein [Rugamonas violacea]